MGLSPGAIRIADEIRLSRAAEMLAGVAKTGHAAEIIENELPSLAEQMRSSSRAGTYTMWGNSTVTDENAGSPVLTRPVFDAIHEIAQVDGAFPIGNAGLIHVYGYLLSDVVTPYGLKRERWLSGELTAALGKGPSEFLPNLGAAPLRPMLERVTDALLPICHREVPNLVSLGHDECFQAGGSTTCLRWLICRHGEAWAAALAVLEGSRTQLVTAFPITPEAADGLKEQLLTGPPRLRWNASVPSFPADPSLASGHTWISR